MGLTITQQYILVAKVLHDIREVRMVRVKIRNDKRRVLHFGVTASNCGFLRRLELAQESSLIIFR